MYKKNKDYFKKIDTAEKAYWLGFLYADGCVSEQYKRGKLKSMVLEISLAEKDKEHLQKFLDSIDSDIPIKSKNIKLGDKTYKASRVNICCTEMCRDLIKLGCTPKKSLTLTFPSEDILPKEFQSHFIRGYFDGDGTVSFYKNNRKTSDYSIYGYKVGFVGTKQMLDSITEILNKETGLPLVSYQNTGKAKQFLYGGFNNMKKSYDYLYKDATLCLSRKEEIFLNTFKVRNAVYGSNVVNY